ncbi:hypothetical protein AGOR_G00101310 [Albula goreensis]|uniref:Gap junction protein n=1 Tax=Albula goreensis TaxID=1534307 RepID=A0A8T3DL17_9TELE|nr:hypothetical protein AGOR_G00101310 [Albula goreensis]
MDVQRSPIRTQGRPPLDSLRVCRAVLVVDTELRTPKVQMISKADWGFLEQLLQQGQEYSTGVGKLWLTVMVVFRVMVLGTAAESAWEDEQSDFVCNTLQPGCEEVCYDKAFPISHYRFFIMQIIGVVSPVILYYCYVVLHLSWELKREAQRREAEGKDTEKHGRVGQGAGLGQLGAGQLGAGLGQLGAGPGQLGGPRLHGRLLWAYLLATLLKLLLELTFILVLWHMYGLTIQASYVCQRWPCPHTVDCFVSRPMEKTVFTLYMQAVAGVSLLLSLLEVCVILKRRSTQHRQRRRHGNIPISRELERVPERLSERGYLHLPAPPSWDGQVEWGAQNGVFEGDLFPTAPPIYTHGRRLPTLLESQRGDRTNQRQQPLRGTYHKAQGGTSL